MGTKKGGARKGKPAGSRKAFDDTKDSKKRPSAASTRKKGVTTKKGMARKGTVAGSRLAYDDTERIKKLKKKRDKKRTKVMDYERKNPDYLFEWSKGTDIGSEGHNLWTDYRKVRELLKKLTFGK